MDFFRMALFRYALPTAVVAVIIGLIFSWSPRLTLLAAAGGTVAFTIIAMAYGLARVVIHDWKNPPPQKPLV